MRFEWSGCLVLAIRSICEGYAFDDKGTVLGLVFYVMNTIARLCTGQMVLINYSL